jgi:hypothetical protein
MNTTSRVRYLAAVLLMLGLLTSRASAQGPVPYNYWWLSNAQLQYNEFFVYPVSFTATGQSMWGTDGRGGVWDYSDHIGPSVSIPSYTIGGISDEGWLGDWGAEVNGYAYANAGLKWHAYANIGSVDVNYGTYRLDKPTDR